jgi:NTE family protein
LVEAIRASTAIPGIFQPVRWEGRLLVDGGMVEPLPVRVCRELGAEIVIAVDVNPRPKPTTPQGRKAMASTGNVLREGLLDKPWVPGHLAEVVREYVEGKPDARPLPGIFEILNQCVAIFVQEILRLKLSLEPPDIYIRPRVREEYNYLRAKENIRAGRGGHGRGPAPLARPPCGKSQGLRDTLFLFLRAKASFRSRSYGRSPAG